MRLLSVVAITACCLSFATVASASRKKLAKQEKKEKKTQKKAMSKQNKALICTNFDPNMFDTLFEGLDNMREQAGNLKKIVGAKTCVDDKEAEESVDVKNTSESSVASASCKTLAIMRLDLDPGMFDTILDRVLQQVENFDEVVTAKTCVDEKEVKACVGEKEMEARVDVKQATECLEVEEVLEHSDEDEAVEFSDEDLFRDFDAVFSKLSKLYNGQHLSDFGIHDRDQVHEDFKAFYSGLPKSEHGLNSFFTKSNMAAKNDAEASDLFDPMDEDLEQMAFNSTDY